jgi:hypothetical protein
MLCFFRYILKHDRTYCTGWLCCRERERERERERLNRNVDAKNFNLKIQFKKTSTGIVSNKYDNKFWPDHVLGNVYRE